MTRSRVTDKDPDNGAWPGQGQAPAGGSGCRSTHCGLDPAARRQLGTHRQFPGDIQGAGCRGVMFSSNVYNVRNVVCMTAYYAGQCSACGLLCWLGWVYLGVGWPGHTYWHMCSGYVNVDITGQMEVSKHHL